MIKINSDGSVEGKHFAVSLSEMGYEGTVVEGKSFWEDPMGAGLTIYRISDTNEIVVDKKGDCSDIESITLKIGGVNVPITPKS